MIHNISDNERVGTLVHGQKGAVPSRRIGAGRDNEREEWEGCSPRGKSRPSFISTPKRLRAGHRQAKSTSLPLRVGTADRRKENRSLLSALSVPVLACSDIDAVNETR